MSEIDIFRHEPLLNQIITYSSLYGGLAQQEPTDKRGIMNRLRINAEEDNMICYPGQYDNENVSRKCLTFALMIFTDLSELESS